MPNGKTDMNNNGAVSTDFIGQNYSYPTNSYVARAQMEKEHLEYIQGLIQYLATSPRSPANLRAEVMSWGPTKEGRAPWEYEILRYELATNIYDATNGSVSYGFIMRTNKGFYEGPN